MIVSRLQNTLIGSVSVIAAAVVIFGFWWSIMGKASGWALLHVPYGFHLIIEHLAGCIFLLISAVVYHKWIAPIGLGFIRRRGSILPAIAVVAVYLVEFVYGKLTGQPQETWVVDLLNQPFWQLVSVFITILILAPVGEEILFRGIALNVFRTDKTWTLYIGWACVAILFSTIHSQYQNVSTLVEMAALSVIFSWARYRSDGLLLPIMLHSMAGILGTILTLI